MITFEEIKKLSLEILDTYDKLRIEYDKVIPVDLVEEFDRINADFYKKGQILSVTIENLVKNFTKQNYTLLKNAMKDTDVKVVQIHQYKTNNEISYLGKYQKMKLDLWNECYNIMQYIILTVYTRETQQDDMLNKHNLLNSDNVLYIKRELKELLDYLQSNSNMFNLQRFVKERQELTEGFAALYSILEKSSHNLTYGDIKIPIGSISLQLPTVLQGLFLKNNDIVEHFFLLQLYALELVTFLKVKMENKNVVFTYFTDSQLESFAVSLQESVYLILRDIDAELDTVPKLLLNSKYNKYKELYSKYFQKMVEMLQPIKKFIFEQDLVTEKYPLSEVQTQQANDFIRYQKETISRLNIEQELGTGTALLNYQQKFET